MKRLLTLLFALTVLVGHAQIMPGVLQQAVNLRNTTPPAADSALLLVWDDILNVPVADSSSVSDWNAFFDLPTNGTPFTSVEVTGDTVKLYGGSGITLTNGETGYVCGLIGGNPQLFEGNAHIVGVNDQAGAIVAVADACFWGTNNICIDVGIPLTTLYIPACTVIGNLALGRCTLLTTLNISSCTTLGSTTGNDGVFNNLSGLTITVTCDASLLTCNEGAPDGDLCYLAANNTITVNSAPLTGCP